MSAATGRGPVIRRAAVPAFGVLVVATAWGMWPDSRAPEGPSPLASPEEEARISARAEQILSRMSTEEKVGQLIQADVRRVTPDDVRRYHLGSVLNGGGGFPNEDKYASVGDWLGLADAMYDASADTSDGGSGVPIIWGVDAVHGHNNVVGATLFPHNIGLGAANNPELIRRIGEVTAREIRVTGHDWNFGPTLAVPRDDRWGRTYEGYSEDPAIVSAYAAAMVEGLQGRPGSGEFLDDYHVLATAKHFLADGGTLEGRDQGESFGTEDLLREVHAPGYVSALAAGVQTVMISFSSWNGVKMHAHRPLLTDFLKGSMGFDGLLVGDWNGHGQVPGCSNESCASSVNAGLDMFMVPEDWKALYLNTLDQVRTGRIPMERLDDAVTRILRVKIRGGVLDRGRPSSRPLAGDPGALGSPDHREVARRAVRESLVLLKNNGGTLPLSPGGRFLVTGDGADDIAKQAGGWTLTWQGTGNRNDDFPGATSIYQGIRTAVEAAGGTAVLSPDGSFDADEPPSAVIVVYGEDPYAEFQGDRTNVDYPRGGGTELDLLRRYSAAGIPVVSVFLTGRPLWVSPELNASDAFVVAWLPGSEGMGVADVLFRREDGSVAHDFRGRLSYSWPRLPDQASLNVGDDEYDPLFPFGYGLSYEDSLNVPRLPEDGFAIRDDLSATRYFGDGPIPPWRLWVQGGASALYPVISDEASAPGGEVSVLAVDRLRQADARRVEWSGSGQGRVLLAAVEPVDLSRETNGAMALAFDIRMDSPPGGPVFLLMGRDSLDPTPVDVTRVLRGLPVGEWATVRIRLRCVAAAGVDMSAVAVPWGVQAGTPGALAFSNVRLVSEGDGPIACPDPAG